ncbi:PREDICTED: uncharacterized protein LOC109182587 [Ipomoea nil]|uniref:uncharacterized protein LOC109182587 n=1 Tax=Ipomoea nil TaxID=35883 RepID=UPI00090084CB|nr:PREDICTED: uncharacterized protein LOC109182587 [Ipomoea nil]
MRKITKSTILGIKRKPSDENKENELGNSLSRNNSDQGKQQSPTRNPARIPLGGGLSQNITPLSNVTNANHFGGSSCTNNTAQDQDQRTTANPYTNPQRGCFSEYITPLSNITTVRQSNTQIGDEFAIRKPLDKYAIVEDQVTTRDLLPAFEDESNNAVSDVSNQNIADANLSGDAVRQTSGIGTSSGPQNGQYCDFGDATNQCVHCGAMFWFEERKKNLSTKASPLFMLCCNNGKIKLPDNKLPPKGIFDLFFGNDELSKEFLHNIRTYNNMFCFTSMGGKIDKNVNKGGAPPIFRLSGQNYHLMGTLLPEQGKEPHFAQLYIYDTANERNNRINAVRGIGDQDDIHVEIVNVIQKDLDENNVLVKSFRMAMSELDINPCAEVKIKLLGKRTRDARTYNVPQVSEVAALIVGDLDTSIEERDIIVQSKGGQLQRITELNPSYLPLQYPILFPYGEDGYREDIAFADVVGRRSSGGRQRISPREFFYYRIQSRQSAPSTILFAKRLFQQFVVDGYTMVESGRLIYIRTHQKSLRCESYSGLTDALTRGDLSPAAQGRRIILPSSFTGGARYMIQNYQDAMAICRWIGYPDLFITFTCNPKWPEVQRFLKDQRLKPEDRPDIICRLFKIKLDALIADCRKNQLFGPVAGEIPDEKKEAEYYQAVEEFMMHGPCGKARTNSPCMVNARCSKHFPKRFVDSSTFDDDGYPVYRRRDNGSVVTKNGIALDNRYVVPHNRYLLLKYKAHINVEWCNQSRSIKYLFKYVNKGHDRVTAEFYKTGNDDENGKAVDEINMYYDCRYISPCEAVWRLFGFDIQLRAPSVERLSFHLPNQQSVIFADDDAVENIVNRPTIAQSMFLEWFEANKTYPNARELTYVEMPTRFVWKKDLRKWQPRKKGFSIGRIFYVPPATGEIFYLRCLLNKVRGPKSYEDIRTVNGVQYDSFRDACYARGLVDDDNEYVDAIDEASSWASADQLRRLFVTLLMSSCMGKLEIVWHAVWQHLSDDAQYKIRSQLQNRDFVLTDSHKMNFALVQIENLLSNHGKSLKDYPEMPTANFGAFHIIANRLIQEELAYDRGEQEKENQELVRQLTDEQKAIYNEVLTDVDRQEGGLFFVSGYGGTGKTFLWRALSSALRSKSQIVLNVASSGIASLLLPGGRTAHSRFAIPISVNEDSTCNIRNGSELAELLVQTKMIIWDEAPMMHKFCFEALDRTLRDLMQLVNPRSSDMTFGGKTVVLGGDFRQILPVIPKGTRPDIVRASISSSYLWQSCKVLRLTKNLRLKTVESISECKEIEEFAKWIANIGDGIIGCQLEGESEITIPEDLLLKCEDDPIATIVDSTFPNFRMGIADLSYLNHSAILAPTLDVVDAVNQYMNDHNPSEGKTYLSCDSVCKSDANVDMLADLHTPEFLNALRCSGVPNHALTLKVGSPVMLLRNIDHTLGLCNGTRLIVTRLGDHVLEGQIMCGTNAGTRVLIPRMSLTPSDTKLPFKFQRKQFPLMLSYAMTINKSQGQTLAKVGLLLKKPVFNHGQLYVAVSRVSNPRGRVP